MKDFKEQFPELDEKCIKLSGAFGINGLFIHPEYNAPTSTLYLFTLEDIEKYCLDKQKVREAIKKYLKKNHTKFTRDEITIERGQFIQYLEQELKF